ncbi:MAG TPA: hypothetical protein VD969_23375 [Symbiobacteriaceae bacterium]|nr:hypothetical protein [Symbiobacteriaceae bacterium]
MSDPFGPALSAMIGPWSLFGPTSFQDYLTGNHIPKKDTAQAISVDHLERLAPSLKAKNTMVLRLGKGHFVLIGTPGHLHDFFLHDDELFGKRPPEAYESAKEAITPYRVFPTLTETSLVNLAFASGLIGHALGLDPPYPTAAPATGSSTYTFRFRPHAHMGAILIHMGGQVEIDAVFTGSRGGKPHLFILEAKSGTDTRTLAKHKLVYPILALAPRVDPAWPIIPIYLRTVADTNAIHYHIAECRFPDPRNGVQALTELEPVLARTHTLCL